VAAAPPSPADLIDLPFARAALEELLLLALAGGLLGTWIVLRRLAFFSHAAGTATFPGLAAAEAGGFSPRLAAFAVAFAYAGGVARGRRGGRNPGDAATALLLVAALAAGTVLASDVLGSSASIDRLLFGTLVGIGNDDLALSALAAVLAGAATLMLGSIWAAAGFDPEGASSAGLPVRRADLLLLLLVAGTVVATLPAVGVLLVTSLLVVPAATARLLGERIASLLGLSVAVAAVQGVAGLYLALWLDVPPGPAIAALGSGLYAVVALAR
jgi:ABC-type Mn2+/Zn2+ transport system permease subunit